MIAAFTAQTAVDVFQSLAILCLCFALLLHLRQR